MSWPLASHFSVMMQNPTLGFRDERLKNCRIEKNAMNQPRPWAGAFAVVYRGTDAQTNESFAIRVFTTESPERRERYEHISNYLAQRKLRCLCDFEYRDRAIRSASDGKWYPLILMDWVEGQTLFEWTRARCLEGNHSALAKAAGRWGELVKELGDASLAHGDLQHANVMVTSAGEMKLVDYDGMCVPALVGRRNLEVGVEPYQHPSRNDATLLSLDLDNFSALMIYLALRGLAAEPNLWKKYVEDEEHDKLLFRTEDLQQGESSPLIQDLLRSPQTDIPKLTKQFLKAARGPMDQVPLLVQVADSFDKIEELLRNEQWDEVVAALNRRGHFRDAPERLKPRIHEAYKYVCRQQAWHAFAGLKPETSESGDRRLVAAWNESLFTGFEPAERQRGRVSQARRRVELLDRLNYTIQQASKEVALDGERRIAEAASPLPQGYQYGLQSRVDEACRRINLVARLEQALDSARVEAAIIAAWRAIVDAGCEHLVERDCRARIKLAEQRAPVLKELNALSRDLSVEQRDERILELWDDSLLAGCLDAQRWRTLREEAAARRDGIERIRKMLDLGSTKDALAILEEPGMAGLTLPADVSLIVEQARRDAEGLSALLGALQAGKRSALREHFDARSIRENPDLFAPYEALLIEWTISDVLAPGHLGLKPLPGGKGIRPAGGRGEAIRLRWTWPAPRLTEQAVVAVCRQHPEPNDGPMDVAAEHRVSIAREQWESAGDCCVIRTRPHWGGCYIAVWCIVDLGFRALHSQPLTLGQVDQRLLQGWGKRLLSSFRGPNTPPQDAGSGV